MIHISNKEKAVVVSFDLNTKINASISPLLKDNVAEIFKQSLEALVFDLTNVKFIDSAGFGALISILKIAKEENATFTLACLSPEVLDLMEIMQLDKVFELTATVEDALK